MLPLYANYYNIKILGVIFWVPSELKEYKAYALDPKEKNKNPAFPRPLGFTKHTDKDC